MKLITKVLDPYSRCTCYFIRICGRTLMISRAW